MNITVVRKRKISASYRKNTIIYTNTRSYVLNNIPLCIVLYAAKSYFTNYSVIGNYKHESQKQLKFTPNN